jgi:ribonuclease PH
MRSVVDLKALGERTIWLDCDVLQGDGGTRCAGVTGSFISLCLAFEEMKKRGILRKLPVREFVAAVSVGIVDGKPCLDLNYDEDSRAEVDMNVIMTGSGKFVEVQGTAEREPFSRSDMDDMLKLAKKGIDGLVAKQKTVLKEVTW